MYLTILKRDLRRKRAMSLIFTAFVMLATAFIGSSIQSLNATVGGLDSYLEKAGVEDYIVLVDEQSSPELEELLKNSENVGSSLISSIQFMISEDDIKINSEGEFSYTSTLGLSYPLSGGQSYFNSSDKQEITKVNKGECYLPYSLMAANNLSTGDKLKVTVGDTSVELKIAGEMLDAVLGSDFISMKRVLLNQEDYDTLLAAASSADNMEYYLYMADINNRQEFTNEFLSSGIQSISNFSLSTLKAAYMMDMIIAVTFAVVSVVLIIIALVVLRFTVAFTMEQEYREIGILKALGIKNSGIRLLYLSKHIALALIGSLLGLGCSLPLGNIMVESASRRIMLEDNNIVVFQILSALAVLVIVLALGYFYTGRVKKISPITAIRSGSTGESFSRSSALSLKRSGFLPLPLFMSLNDILSGIKKFAMMILIFTLGVIMINIPSNAVSTLKSDEMIYLMQMSPCDGAVIYGDNDIISKSRSEIEKELDEVKAKLKDNGIEAEVFREIVFQYTLSHNENLVSSIAAQGIYTDTEDYRYTEGTPPELENEVAVTSVIAQNLGADIGDIVEIAMDGESRKFIITALFESMSNMGEGVRFTEDTELDYEKKIGAMGIQFRFTDELSEEEKQQRLDEIQDIFPDYEVVDVEGYIDSLLGDSISDMLDSVSKVILIIVMAINALIAVLMVRTFITRERGDIAMLKSLGFKNRTLVLWQSLRISLVLIVSVILGALVTLPLSSWILGYVFGIMGASSVNVVVDPLMSYCVYPLILLAVTTVCALLSALQLKGIRARDINNME